MRWVRGYPERGADGCVYYVAQWSDGTYSATPWECGGRTIQSGNLTASRIYPQRAANGCIEYVAQWSDGSYTWVPFSCPAGTVYHKPVQSSLISTDTTALGACLGVPAYWEIRPANTTANRTLGAPIPSDQYQPWNPGFAPYKDLIDGRGCQGTTEQILEWAAKKWGFADTPSPLGGPALHLPDLAKAMAVQESDWRQGLQGDFHSGRCDWTGGPACPYPDGYQSYGLLQVKRTSWPGSYPHSARSTAFAADYAMAAVRHYYDGASWLPSLRGDLWGAVEGWYSGTDDSSGDWYRAAVYDSYQTKPWKQAGY